jgi:GH15 family glucan-1,4-alpha-glucosidase
MPLVRFISPTDPRWLSTLKAVGEQLVDDSLVFRYSTEQGTDGLFGGEGTFNMCSFRYVECLARAGDLAEARFLFEKMLGYANHLGLFAKELGPAGEHLGNFPPGIHPSRPDQCRVLSGPSLVRARWSRVMPGRLLEP